MTNKKQALKGVIIYLLITFAIIIPTSTLPLSELAQTNTATRVIAAFFAFISAFSPAIGAVLTRIITKEGFKDMKFRLNFKGNKKYYLAAIVIPIVYCLLNQIMTVPFYKNCLNPDVNKEIPMKLIMLVFYVSMSLIQTVVYMGEELGWRDYLYPRLEKLMGAPLTILVGGIIWALWHLPARLMQGGPDIEFLFFSLFTIFLGSFLFWLTKRTDSIYPAAIAHTVNNSFALFFSTIIFDQDKLMQTPKPIIAEFMNLLPVIILGTICLVLLMRNKKEQ